jgi:hypothetical protein
MLLHVCDLPGMSGVACVPLIVNTHAVASVLGFHVKFLAKQIQIYMKNKKSIDGKEIYLFATSLQ